MKANIDRADRTSAATGSKVSNPKPTKAATLSIAGTDQVMATPNVVPPSPAINDVLSNRSPTRPGFDQEDDDDKDERRDLSRPLYDRPTGQLGLYVDVYSTTPSESRKFGSYLLFLHELMEKLFSRLKAKPLFALKGHFLRRRMLQGVIFESIKQGIVFSLSFEDVASLDALWRDYEEGEISDAMRKMLLSPDVDCSIRESVGSKSIEYRTRLFRDEFDRCRNELLAGDVASKTLNDRPTDVSLLRYIREQQRILSAKIVSVKDGLRSVDQHLTEFILTYKQLISTDILSTKSLAEFETTVRKAKESRENRLSLIHLEGYLMLIDDIRDVLRAFEEDVYHPLTQIHDDCETSNQKEMKSRIGLNITRMQTQLAKDSDLSTMRHPAIKCRILVREEGLFMGLLSLATVALEATENVDNDLDEYFSAHHIQTLLSKMKTALSAYL